VEERNTMGYVLGIDLGTTYTAAAVRRDGRSHVVDLGTRLSAVPSVVLLREDETILTGEAAQRRALTEPDRVAREFKRRVGDPTPLLLGGAPVSVEALMAKLLRWVVDTVAEREGGPPDAVAISHPANWGAFKVDVLHQAVRMADLGAATLLTEPEAAAIHYASQERVEPSTTVAVYDLGGGTFDAAVLRKVADGWEILGQPEGIDRLGGIDFDAAVFAHVQRSLAGKLEELDPDDPAAQAAVARLRDECVAAKEALSADTDVSIPVLLPNVQTEVRLTRAEFEAMIRPSLADSIDALRRALRSAGVEAADVSIVLLVGGSSRVPLVAQLVGAELGRPVALDVHPKHAVSLGAALAADPGAVAAPPAAPVDVVAPEADSSTIMARPDPVADAVPVAAAAAVVATPPEAPVEPSPPPAPPAAPQAPPAAPQAPPPEPPPAAPQPPPAPPTGPQVLPPGAGTPPPSGGGSRTGVLIGVGVVVALIVAVAAFALLGGDDDEGDETSSTEPTTEGTDTTDTTGTDATTTTTPDLAAGCDRAQQVCITGVTFREGPDPLTGETIDGLVATYETERVLSLPGNTGSVHAHFYLAPELSAETSGTNGGSGGWQIWSTTGEYSPFAEQDVDGEGLTRADVGTNTELCVTVANELHQQDPATEHCVPLPA
jgi:actin-like ATPase involved in cell morphogenesis